MSLTEEQKAELRRQSQVLAGVFDSFLAGGPARPAPPAAPAPLTFKLTQFQYDEVEGLLDVVDDELSMGNVERILWGTVGHLSHVLTVLDAAEAIEELEYRARVIEEEAPGHGSNGGPGARSLRELASKIREQA